MDNHDSDLVGKKTGPSHVINVRKMERIDFANVSIGRHKNCRRRNQLLITQ